MVHKKYMLTNNEQRDCIQIQIETLYFLLSDSTPVQSAVQASCVVKEVSMSEPRTLKEHDPERSQSSMDEESVRRETANSPTSSGACFWIEVCLE